MELDNIGMVERNTTHDRIVEKLEKMILNKKFEPGQKLPSQDKLAKKLGVSRSTLREALNSLKTMGLIEVQHGNGTFVKDFRSDNLLDSFSSYLQLNKKNIMEVMEVRRFLELTTVELAAKKATKEDIKEIENAYRIMYKNKNQYKNGAYDLFCKDDMNYHKAIVSATENDLFKEIINDIQDYIKIEQIGFIQAIDNLDEIIAQHENILDGIKNKNVDKAKKNMEKHIQTIESVIMKAKED